MRYANGVQLYFVPVVKRIERQIADLEVAGSSPAGHTNLKVKGQKAKYKIIFLWQCKEYVLHLRRFPSFCLLNFTL